MNKPQSVPMTPLGLIHAVMVTVLVFKFKEGTSSQELAEPLLSVDSTYWWIQNQARHGVEDG